MGPLPRPSFESVRAYGQIFTDAAYWRPYVAEVCAWHGLGPCREIRAGQPGTFPVFIVDGRAVVKFFGDLFAGGARFRVEREMYALVDGDPAIPAPGLIASGALFAGDDGWSWPYIVTGMLPGVSLSEVAERLSWRDRVAVCRFLTPVVRRIHALAPEQSSPLSRTWDSFERFLAERRAGCAARHRAWGTLPARLIAQLDDYLPSLAGLIERGAAPHVLHCDLNADHVLGTFADGRWQPSGIIDFGDAMAGDRLYELVALHLGLFRCDKRLLRIFLDAYGLDAGLQRDFARRAMSLTLLHEFDVLAGLFSTCPSAGQVESLAELAALLWDLELAGLLEIGVVEAPDD